MRRSAFVLFLLFIVLSFEGCSTSLGAQLGLHKVMPDEMIYDAIKSHHDQSIIDRYSAAGSEASALMRWAGAENDPHNTPFLQELRAEMVKRNPQWSERVKKAVLAGKIIKGMDEKQVLSTLGSPSERQDAHIGGKYALQTWQYIAQSTATSFQSLGIAYRGSAARGGVKYYAMVMFRDGKVTSLQTFN